MTSGREKVVIRDGDGRMIAFRSFVPDDEQTRYDVVIGGSAQGQEATMGKESLGDDFDLETASVEELVAAVAYLKEKSKDVLELLDEVQRRACIAMNEADIKKITLEDGRPITLVEGTEIVFMEEKLKKALGKTLWRKVTKRVLDRNKLEDLAVSGELPMDVVADCSEEKPRKPYLLVGKSRNHGEPSAGKEILRRALAQKPGPRKRQTRG